MNEQAPNSSEENAAFKNKTSESKEPIVDQSKNFTRRDFLKGAGLIGIAAAGGFLAEKVVEVQTAEKWSDEQCLAWFDKLKKDFADAPPEERVAIFKQLLDPSHAYADFRRRIAFESTKRGIIQRTADKLVPITGRVIDWISAGGDPEIIAPYEERLDRTYRLVGPNQVAKLALDLLKDPDDDDMRIETEHALWAMTEFRILQPPDKGTFTAPNWYQALLTQDPTFDIIALLEKDLSEYEAVDESQTTLGHVGNKNNIEHGVRQLLYWLKQSIQNKTL